MKIDVIFKETLLFYGMAHRNIEYHTRKEEFAKWYNLNSKKLSEDKTFVNCKDKLDCYLRVLNYFK